MELVQDHGLETPSMEALEGIQLLYVGELDSKDMLLGLTRLKFWLHSPGWILLEKLI